MPAPFLWPLLGTLAVLLSSNSTQLPPARAPSAIRQLAVAATQLEAVTAVIPSGTPAQPPPDSSPASSRKRFLLSTASSPALDGLIAHIATTALAAPPLATLRGPAAWGAVYHLTPEEAEELAAHPSCASLVEDGVLGAYRRGLARVHRRPLRWKYAASQRGGEEQAPPHGVRGHGPPHPRRLDVPLGRMYTQRNAPWHLARISSRQPGAQDYRYVTSGRGTLIFIVDSGINAEHEEFAGRLEPGFNTVPDRDAYDTTDCAGHGTHVSGLAAVNECCAP